jgi:single-stranded DNA-specific DHH superfamily exonuclease
MLTKQQIEEIREHLEKAQNPVFFFDNDPDGLCSFLLLQRYIQRGRGIAIRSFPEMKEEYFKKVEELNADYIFILDKPVVSKEFFDEAKKFNLPIVWIDHHKIDDLYVPEFVNYYNPVKNKTKESEPVTYLCQKIANRKDDLWIAVIGCISDRYIPDFYEEFEERYPDLAIKSKEAFELFYKSQIGRIARMFCFALKDKTSNVTKMLKFLSLVKTPYEVLEENSKNKEMHIRFKQISKKSEKFIEKAKNLNTSEKILFFQYSGELSISADLANELSYIFPDKIIVVIYTTGIKANISIRGEKIKDISLKTIQEIDGATGGGHENAIGAQVKIGDLEKFKKTFKEFISK